MLAKFEVSKRACSHALLLEEMPDKEDVLNRSETSNHFKIITIN